MMRFCRKDHDCFIKHILAYLLGRLATKSLCCLRVTLTTRGSFLRFLNFNLYGSREKLAPVFVLDLTGLKNTVFECVSNLRALLYLNPGETVVHIDIHKFACVISRLYFISWRAPVTRLAEPGKERVSADPLEPNITKWSDYQTVRVEKYPALGRPNTHLFIVENELIGDRLVALVYFLCEELRERVNLALVDICDCTNCETLLHDAVRKPNNVLICDNSTVWEQGPSLW